MNDHNLDDLIIDNIEPRNKKSKSLLTIFALLIVVLIVGIIFIKIILNDPEKPLVVEDSETEMISPELTLQDADKPKSSKEATKLSSIIEEELEAPVKIPSPKKEAATAEISAKSIEPKKVSVPEPLKRETVKTIKEPIAVIEAPETKPMPVKKEMKHEVSVVTPIKNEMKKVIQTPKKPKTAVSRNIYYIQVCACKKITGAKIVNVVKNNGFKYKIVSTPTSKKLRVGPYSSRQAADNALVRVRDLIKKDAFIVKQ